MCSRPVGQPPATYPGQYQKTPVTSSDTKVYKNQQEYMVEQDEIAIPIELAELHRSNLDNPAIPPDAGHTKAEQKQNLRKQALLKEMQSIEKKIEKLQKEMRRHEKSNATLLSSDTGNRLTEYRNRHKALVAELNGAARKSKTPADDGSERTSIEVSTASSSSSSQSASSSTSDSDDASLSSTLPRGMQDGTQHEFLGEQDTHAASSVSSSPDVMATAKTLLEEMEKSLREKAERRARLDMVSDDHNALEAEEQDIKNQEEAIKSLREMMNQILMQTSPRSAEGKKTARTQPMTSLVRTKTGQRPSQATTTRPSSQHRVNDNHKHGDNDKHANLAEIHESANHLLLRMPEDQRQRFSTKDAKKIADLEKEIDRLAAQADTAFQGFARLQNAIARDIRNGDVPEKTMEAKERRRDKFKEESLQCSVKLAALIEEWESYAELVDPETPKSPKQRAEERKALIEKFKSDETRKLEKLHAEKLAELHARVENDPGSSIGWDALAGILGFSVSFLIGNTVGRMFPGAAWVGAGLSAPFHVIFATPVVKNLMARTWSADSLAEFNNYFKLLGNRWGDARRGETEVRKYDSRDPTQTNKLTIDQRMAENKSFAELLNNRYRDEEAGYWSYTFNYTIKAAMMAYMSQWMSQDKIEVKVTEAAWHGIMGMVSGAEYVMFQQHARSTQPGAKMTVVPTREIFAAQADSLKSLFEDLTNAVRQDPEKPDTHLDPATLRTLRKESARIAKEMLAAERKSRVAGIAGYELVEQFRGDAKWDTLSEVLGRFITLIPTSAVIHLTTQLRKSPDPLMMFLGHFIPAVALIQPLPLPIPGFTGRPYVCGIIRAGLQMFVSGRTTPTVTTHIPAEVRQASEEGSNRPVGNDRSDETSKRVSGDSDDSSSEKVSGDSDDSSSEKVGGDSDDDDSSSEESGGKVRKTLPDDVLVDVSDTSSDDEDQWTGNPTERDRNAAN